jgi:hypothetical protein
MSYLSSQSTQQTHAIHILNLSIPRFFVVCVTGPTVECLMLKASVILVYVAMWRKGLKLRNPARLHSTLYLQTQYPAATNGMPWIKQCHIPSALRTPAY